LQRQGNQERLGTKQESSDRNDTLKLGSIATA